MHLFMEEEEENGIEYLNFEKLLKNHRSKIHIAEIRGLHPEHKFKRKFLKRWEDTKYLLDLFDEGTIYEIKIVHYKDNGQKVVVYDDFYIFRGYDDEGNVYFENIGEEGVYNILAQTESISKYLVSLLKKRKYKEFIYFLRNYSSLAVFLIQELADDKEVFNRYIKNLSTSQYKEVRDILIQVAKSNEGIMKQYALFVLAYWKNGVFLYKEQKEIKYLRTHLTTGYIPDPLRQAGLIGSLIADFSPEPRIRLEMAFNKYLTRYVEEYFSYNPSLAAILGRLTKITLEKLTAFDYKTFFENHPSFFEILSQLSIEQQITVYNFIFGFIMQLITDKLSTNEYDTETKFVADFFTILRKNLDNNTLVSFIKTWEILVDMKFYKKVLRSSFKEIMEKENLLQIFVESDTQTRQEFVNLLDKVNLSVVYVKIAIDALKQGEYQVFYDIFVAASNQTAIMKKLELLIKKLLEKKDIAALSKLVAILKKLEPYIKDNAIKQLLEKINFDLAKTTNNSVFDL